MSSDDVECLLSLSPTPMTSTDVCKALWPCNNEHDKRLGRTKARHALHYLESKGIVECVGYNEEYPYAPLWDLKK